MASRSLTAVEQRYSQTEREALAVTWGILHYHLHVYGHNFKVITDHRALLPMFNNPRSSPPLCVQRWILKLQEYDFELAYKPGKFNPADYMPRHPLRSTRPASREEQATEEYINFVAVNAVPKTVTLDQMKTATKDDSVLQLCTEAVISGKWN